MAKKKKKDNIDNIGKSEEKKEDGGGNKLVSVLIALVIVIIWLAIFALLIKLDVGGFGSNVLTPVLKDVPFINRILPGYSAYEDSTGAKYRNLDEAMAKIQELEQQIASMGSTGTANSDYIADLENENARLKVFEQEQQDFAERVKEFEEKVVFNDRAPALEDYKAFYEEINPENAAKLYQQVVEQIQIDQKIIDQGAQFTKMDPANAAQILEVMTGDIDLVCKILETMKPEQSAAIIQEMSTEYAAKITKKSSVLE